MRACVRACARARALVSLFVLLFLCLFTYFPIYPRLLCFAFSVRMFSFFLCRPFVVDIVDALVMAVFGLSENHTLIVLLDSCTTTGVFE